MIRPCAVELPTDLHARLVNTSTARGHVMATLIRSWVVLAASRARAGEELPPGRRRGSARAPGSHRQTRWRQDADELAACRAAIDAAGSSLRAVVEEAARRYVSTTGRPSVVEQAHAARRSWCEPETVQEGDR